jgi:hypothetical protein
MSREIIHPTNHLNFLSVAMITSVIIPAAIRTNFVRSIFALFVVIAVSLLVLKGPLHNFELKTRRLFKRSSQVLFGLFATVYLAANFILPFIGRFFRPEESVSVLSDSSSHYAVTVIPGHDFICCQTTWLMKPTGYGLGMPLFSAALLALRKLWSPFESGVALKFVTSTSQLLLFLLSFLLFRLICKKTSVRLVTLLIVTTQTFSFTNLDAPNLTALRYIPFVLFLIGLKLIGELQSTYLRTTLLSLTSSLVIMLSFEIGIITFCASLGYTIIRSNQGDTPSPKLTTRLLLFTSSFSIFLIMQNLVVSLFLDGSSFLESFTAVSNSAIGYGGLVVRWHPEALLFFSFAAFEFTSNIQIYRQGRARSNEHFKIAISVMMIGWLIYYFYRQNPNNLTFQWVLLITLISADSKNLFLSARRLDPKVLSLIFLVCWSVSGSLSGSVRTLVNQESCAYRPPAPIVATKCLDQTAYMQISDYLDKLKSIQNKKEYIVFSYLPAEIRLLGFNDQAPFYDLKFGVVNEQSESSIVTWIENNRPLYVFSHNPTSSWSMSQPEENQKVQRILSKIQGYRVLISDSETVTFFAAD